MRADFNANKGNSLLTVHDTRRFLKLVRDRPVLWNTQDIDHAHNMKRRDAWGQIATVLKNGITPKQAKDKYRNLKAKYKRELSIMEETKQSHSDWKYFADLSFIDVKKESRSNRLTSGNKSRTASQSSSSVKMERMNSDGTHDMLDEMDSFPDFTSKTVNSHIPEALQIKCYHKSSFLSNATHGDKTASLLETIMDYPILWKYNEYQPSESKVRNTWKKVVEDLPFHVSVREARNRFKENYQQFCRELSKLKKREENGDMSLNSRWKYFQYFRQMTENGQFPLSFLVHREETSAMDINDFDTAAIHEEIHTPKRQLSPDDGNDSNILEKNSKTTKTSLHVPDMDIDESVEYSNEEYPNEKNPKKNDEQEEKKNFDLHSSSISESDEELFSLKDNSTEMPTTNGELLGQLLGKAIGELSEEKQTNVIYLIGKVINDTKRYDTKKMFELYGIGAT
ncbi:hypothetical protein SNEBB_008839 [Seison nebaliae]|nr:hypothetical protein SNEBB_008839 [Seison nebaliae]